MDRMPLASTRRRVRWLPLLAMTLGLAAQARADFTQTIARFLTNSSSGAHEPGSISPGAIDPLVMSKDSVRRTLELARAWGRSGRIEHALELARQAATVPVVWEEDEDTARDVIRDLENAAELVGGTGDQSEDPARPTLTPLRELDEDWSSETIPWTPPVALAPARGSPRRRDSDDEPRDYGVLTQGTRSASDKPIDPPRARSLPNVQEPRLDDELPAKAWRPRPRRPQQNVVPPFVPFAIIVLGGFVLWGVCALAARWWVKRRRDRARAVTVGAVATSGASRLAESPTNPLSPRPDGTPPDELIAKLIRDNRTLQTRIASQRRAA